MKLALTYEEVKELGGLLRKSLVDSIREFEESTGLAVERIDVIHEMTIGSPKRTADVNIEIQLTF